MEIINCTKNEIKIVDSQCCVYEEKYKVYTLIKNPQILEIFEPSGVVPQCKVYRHRLDDIDGIPFFCLEYGEIRGLPDSRKNTFLIVPKIVAIAGKLRGRRDLLLPADMVKTTHGSIVGFLGFSV